MPLILKKIKTGSDKSLENISLIKKIIFLFLGGLIIIIPFLLITELFLIISNDEWRQAERLNIIRDTRINSRTGSRPA